MAANGGNDLKTQMNPDNIPDASAEHADVESGGGGDGGGQAITHTITPPSDGAQKTIEDIKSLSKSVFKDERTATLWWIGFTTFYWTLLVWIPCIIETNFAQAGFFGWCVAFMALITNWYTWREGRWPSGATRDNPEETGGIGRYAAFGLECCIVLDFLVLLYYGVLEGATIPSVIRGVCHTLSMLWGTLFFFNRFYHSNPDIAITAFFGEWADIGLTVIVLFVLHNALDDDGNEVHCFEKAVCTVYFVCYAFQLMGWIFPMMLIEGWGTGADGNKVSRHLFIVDLLTDIPIIMTVLIEDAYQSNVIILIDVLWKTILTIRSIGYYMIYEIWLQKGNRVFTRNLFDRKRGDTLK